MGDMPERISGRWLNELSVEQRAEVLRGPCGQRMHGWAASYVTFVRWTTETASGIRVNNGSIFFLDLGSRLLAVTAAHVYHGYISAKYNTRHILCHIENIEFDPEQRLRGQRDGIDIVSFDFTYRELKQIGKQALVVDLASWPPPHPFSGQGAFLVGFPGAARQIDKNSISFGLYSGFEMINCASELQITCPFQRDDWIDTVGHGLPPQGLDLGGISGGPLLIPIDNDGVWDFYVGGVISEAQTSLDYETVVSVPAHFIAPDGTIHDGRSAPVRHFLR